MAIAIAILGAAGRMGQSLVATAQRDSNLQIAALIEHPSHPQIGSSQNGVPISGDFENAIRNSKVCVDFSSPMSTVENLKHLVAQKIPTVIGTTGLSEDQMQIIRDSSKHIPIVFASNFSTGVNLLWKVLSEVGASIPTDYDIEIVEAHHRFKKDAPSGTALSTAKVIQSVRAGEVPMHAVRAGGIVGEHKVICASLGDVLEFKHTAISRDTFSEGALRASKWIIGKKPGLYSMQDVLFS
jgi:4-hydroxy-tetrahydrodipicolinate reductase